MWCQKTRCQKHCDSANSNRKQKSCKKSFSPVLGNFFITLYRYKAKFRKCPFLRAPICIHCENISSLSCIYVNLYSVVCSGSRAAILNLFCTVLSTIPIPKQIENDLKISKARRFFAELKDSCRSQLLSYQF